MAPLESAQLPCGEVYEWLCQRWDECQADAAAPGPRKGGGGGPASAVTRSGAAASTAALFHGLPASFGHVTAQTGDAARRMLLASRRQRERQEALLQQADRHLADAAKQKPKAGLQRVGGAPRAYRWSAPGLREAQAVAAAAGQSAGDGRPGRTRPEVPRGAPAPSLLSPRRHSSPGPRAAGTPAEAAAFEPPRRSPCRSPSPARQPSPRGAAAGRGRGRGRAAAAAPAVPAAPPAPDVELAAPLLARGLLASAPRPWPGEAAPAAADDLAHVRALFAAQLPGLRVLGVYRVENERLAGVHEAVRASMGSPPALDLWHGTTAACARSIAVGGFNRAYSGRHGTRLGRGTYFSTAAEYSLRFCGPRSSTRRVMFLASVLVGSCTVGSPELVEPPYRDSEEMVRYDATVDDTEAPTMFCVFRDFQALPRYLVEFAGDP